MVRAGTSAAAAAGAAAQGGGGGSVRVQAGDGAPSAAAAMVIAPGSGASTGLQAGRRGQARLHHSARRCSLVAEGAAQGMAVGEFDFDADDDARDRDEAQSSVGGGGGGGGIVEEDAAASARDRVVANSSSLVLARPTSTLLRVSGNRPSSKSKARFGLLSGLRSDDDGGGDRGVAYLDLAATDGRSELASEAMLTLRSLSTSSKGRKGCRFWWTRAPSGAAASTLRPEPASVTRAASSASSPALPDPLRRITRLRPGPSGRCARVRRRVRQHQQRRRRRRRGGDHCERQCDGRQVGGSRVAARRSSNAKGGGQVEVRGGEGMQSGGDVTIAGGATSRRRRRWRSSGTAARPLARRATSLAT